jgi:hypothetical protein
LLGISFSSFRDKFDDLGTTKTSDASHDFFFYHPKTLKKIDMMAEVSILVWPPAAYAWEFMIWTD